jgi:hypothetical protein
MLAQGRENAKQALRDRTELASSLEQDVRARLIGTPESTPAGDEQDEEM